jgi:hypothetical protein
MADARRRAVHAVVVLRFDRLARSVAHLARALDEFRALGVEFVSLHEASRVIRDRLRAASGESLICTTNAFEDDVAMSRYYILVHERNGARAESSFPTLDEAKRAAQH